MLRWYQIAAIVLALAGVVYVSTPEFNDPTEVMK